MKLSIRNFAKILRADIEDRQKRREEKANRCDHRRCDERGARGTE